MTAKFKATINSTLTPIICQLADAAGITNGAMVNALLVEALEARGLDVPELMKHGGVRKGPKWQAKL